MTAPVSIGTVTAAVPNGTERQQLKEAAQQFEAILVRQMLAAARSTDFGGEDLFGGEAEETFREMRDGQFAQIVSESGTLGLAASIEAQLARHLGAEG